MKKQYVYRVEHLEYANREVFAGPYPASGIHDTEDWSDDLSDHQDKQHPQPEDDPKLKKHLIVQRGVYLNYFCGFKTLKSLMKWFSKTELNQLSELNYAIAKYEAQEVISGSKQVLFIPVKNNQRSLIDIKTIF